MGAQKIPAGATSRRLFVQAASALPVAATFAGAPALARVRRPNIVMIVVDDMRFDEYAAGGHPYIETPHIDSLSAKGASFTRAYHATPLCSPNRASILTGQYASRHGILDNTSRNRASHMLSLFAIDLQRAGYETAHIGKWHMGNDPSPRPGYDYWVSFEGQGRSIDPILYEDGALRKTHGYMTDLLTERALAFVRKKRSKPFFLYLGHKAVHPDITQNDDGSISSENSGFVPAPRHQGRYDGQVVDRRPNHGFDKNDAKSKPVLAQAYAIKNSDEVLRAVGGMVEQDVAEDEIRRRAEMILAIDEGLGALVEALAEQRLLDDTMIVFTSDNGYFYGEHGLTVERRLPYEEAIRAPVLVRYPDWTAPGARIGAFASSVDFAPTMLEAAGAAIPAHIQGKSLGPLLRDEEKAIREAMLVEYYSHENPIPWTVAMDYRVVLKRNFKLIKWLRFDDADELYDLDADPFEENNLFANPAFGAVNNELRADLRDLATASLGLAD
jgi:N-acetylglucosamine-6-sulfatase